MNIYIPIKSEEEAKKVFKHAMDIIEFDEIEVCFKDADTINIFISEERKSIMSFCKKTNDEYPPEEYNKRVDVEAFLSNAQWEPLGELISAPLIPKMNVGTYTSPPKNKSGQELRCERRKNERKK